MSDRTHLQMILADSPIGVVLPEIAQLHLPNWWLAGGAVRNTVWRSLFGRQCQLFINDFDVAFFDSTGDRTQELVAKEIISPKFPEHKFDIKNQASFGRWRSGERTYWSTEEGIQNWLHTATSVGVRLDPQGQWEFFTPYGLDDLFAGIIRPTPTHLHDLNAQSKGAGFLLKCPCLRLG